MNTLVMSFILAAHTYHLPPKLLDSICFIESSYNVNAIHKDDGAHSSLGVCQVQLPTARTVGFKGTEKDLMDPSTNIMVAAAVLRYQLDRYNGNAQKAVIAYNYGHAPKNLTYTAYQIKVFTRWGTNNVQKWSTSKVH